MGIAALAVCWGTTLLWQADVRQAQCSGYMWLVYLPGSFLVQLVNMKAYRLSTFLTYLDRRPKPFPHGRVMRLTLLSLIVTVILVLIAATVDPPTRHRVVVDPYRAKLDYYYCHTTGVADALMYVLVTGHVVVSMSCVISVRNGLDAFKDGMIIKEAFVLLYAFVLVAWIIQHLKLSAAVTYMLRSIMINLGVTLFLVRLLINRCIRHWLPQILLDFATSVHQKYVRTYIEGGVHLSSQAEGIAVALSSDQAKVTDESPLYQIAAPEDSNVDEMLSAISDPRRGALFRQLAKSLLIVENVDFLVDVLAYRNQTENEIVKFSAAANPCVQEAARNLYIKYIKTGADDEVNVSSNTRSQIEKILGSSSWVASEPFVSRETAAASLSSDPLKRGVLFQPAFKEISHMLYQNAWHKFKAHEAEVLAGHSGEPGLESLN